MIPWGLLYSRVRCCFLVLYPLTFFFFFLFGRSYSLFVRCCAFALRQREAVKTSRSASTFFSSAQVDSFVSLMVRVPSSNM